MPVSRLADARRYVKHLRERLTDGRISHSVFTAEYLSAIAPPLGVDHDEAVLAGLLHDYCRDLKKAAFLEQARARRFPISDCQLEKPSLLHGPLAAEICREEFGIGDAVYEAIYWHTTGRPRLGLLGCALYVADFAEPSRRFPEAARARELLSKEGFPKALRYVAEEKWRRAREKTITDPNTEAFLIWLNAAGDAAYG